MRAPGRSCSFMPSSNRLMKPKDVFQLLLLAAIWGSSFLFLRIAAPAIGITLTLGLRISIAALAMVLVFAFVKKLPDYKAYWKQYLVLGFLNLVAPFALVTFSVANLNASIGAILNATTPLFTMVLSSFWLKEKLSVKKLSGLFIGMAGLTVLVGWIPIAMTGRTILSVLFSLLASLSYGLGAVYTRIHFRNTDPLQTATGQLSAAAIVVLPLLIFSGSDNGLDVKIVVVILALALLCTALGYALYFKLISSIGSTNTSTVTLLVPVFSIIWSMLFLHEPITPALAVGLGLILGSLKLVLTSPK
jgi:drug/metabolite transporter (DMT)-like permease